LRLSGGTLAPSAHHQHHRVAVCDRAAAPTGDERGWFPHEGADDGVQVTRDGRGALAKSEWLGAVAARARWRPFRRWRARETKGHGRKGEGERRLTHSAIQNM